MNYIGTQKFCAWSGIASIVLFGLALWPLSGFLPPLSPTLSAVEVASFYQTHVDGIRFGMLLMMISGGFVAPFVAVISIQLRRIEGVTPILAYTQLAAGAAGILFFLLPALLFTATAYRPDRTPELTMIMNDTSWIVLVMAFPPAFVQNVAIGFAIINDRSAQLIFPRWVGFLNFWVALLFLPGGMLTFFKTGPFAWNGILAFYLPGAAFGVWFIVMVTMLLKAINRQAEIGPTPVR